MYPKDTTFCSSPRTGEKFEAKQVDIVESGTYDCQGRFYQSLLKFQWSEFAGHYRNGVDEMKREEWEGRRWEKEQILKFSSLSRKIQTTNVFFFLVIILSLTHAAITVYPYSLISRDVILTLLIWAPTLGPSLYSGISSLTFVAVIVQ